MIWDQTTITRVKGIWVQLDLDESLIHAAGDEARRAVRARLAAAFIDLAHPYGVEVHPDDLRFDEAPRELVRGPGITTRATWRPATDAVELHGGRGDGRVIHLTTRSNFRVPVPASPSVSSSADADTTASWPFDDYQCTGWNESTRRWVYTLASR